FSLVRPTKTTSESFNAPKILQNEGLIFRCHAPSCWPAIKRASSVLSTKFIGSRGPHHPRRTWEQGNEGEVTTASRRERAAYGVSTPTLSLAATGSTN